MASKKFLYVNRKAPHGTVYAQESLEVVLIGAAFEQDVSRWLLSTTGFTSYYKTRTPAALGNKNFSPTYRALGDYDVNQIYVEQESLELRGLSKEDLMPLTYEDEDDDWAEKDSIHVVSSAELADIIEQQDVILNF